MATQIVEMTGDESKLLKSIQAVIQKQVEYDRKLQETASSADAAGIAVGKALDDIKADADKALGGMLRDMNKLGPEGQAIAGALKDRFREVGGAGIVPMDQMLARLRLIDPAAADAAESARTAFAGLQADQVLDGLMTDLRSIGPEGASAAKAMQQHLQLIENAGKGGMDEIIAKIREMNPEAAAAAEAAAATIRTELAEAAQYSEREFGGVLDELRAMGPAGREVAAQLKTELVAAGKVGEKSMDDVLAKLERMDPAAAQAGREIARNLEEAGNRGENAFQKFGKSAVAELGSIVAAYVGIQAAVQLVTDYLKTQLDLINEARKAQIDLGKAQQDALKNLAGLTVIERNDLLKTAVPSIAAQAGFADTAAITQAIGTVASVGESDPARIANAVLQAARIETLNPEKLSTTAAAAVDVQRKAGLQDVREGIALFQTTLSQARIESADALGTALPKAVGSAVATVPDQDRLTAAREAAALFSQITQGGTDTQGQSSATFITDLTVRLQKFFTGIDEEQIAARSQIELIDRKISKGSETELDLLKKSRAEAFLGASAGLQDSGTIFGRLSQLQGNEALAQQFVGEGFGEKQFAIVLQDLINANSERVNALRDSFNVIQADANFFEQQVGTLNTSTPQLAIANAQARLEAGRAANQLTNTDGSTVSQIRQIVSTVLLEEGGITGYLESGVVARGLFSDGTATGEAVSGIRGLDSLLQELLAGGVTAEEQRRVDFIQGQIDNLLQLVNTTAGQGALKGDAEQVERRLRADRDITPRLVEQLIAALNGKMTELIDETKQTRQELTRQNPTAPTPVTPALGAVGAGG